MSGVQISSLRNAVGAHNRVEVALGLRGNQIKMLMTLSIQLSRQDSPGTALKNEQREIINEFIADTETKIKNHFSNAQAN